MRLGYGTNAFPFHGLDDALRVIAGIGYRSVGLTLDHRALSPLRGDPAADAYRYRELLQDLDLLPVVETASPFLLDPWRQHHPTLLDEHPGARRRREEFLERAIDTAVQIGASVVSVRSGAAPAVGVFEVLEWRLVGALERLAEYAAARGIVLGLEPRLGMHVATMADYARVHRQVSHPALRLTLDVGNAHRTEEDGAIGAVHRFSSEIAHVHLAGAQRDHPQRLLPWDGDLDVPAVLRSLADEEYAGPSTYDLSHDVPDPVQTARQALAFAQKALACP